jgi:hypothetical protein
MVFENRLLRRIFGVERDEVTGEWRKLHNAELNDLYCEEKYYSCGQMEEMSGTSSMIGGEERCMRGFGGET